jgi:hypothetical protein
MREHKSRKLLDLRSARHSQNPETQMRLSADGFGGYFGTINSDQFKQALVFPSDYIFSVMVQTPSAFKR